MGTAEINVPVLYGDKCWSPSCIAKLFVLSCPAVLTCAHILGCHISHRSMLLLVVQVLPRSMQQCRIPKESSCTTPFFTPNEVRTNVAASYIKSSGTKVYSTAAAEQQRDQDVVLMHGGNAWADTLWDYYARTVRDRAGWLGSWLAGPERI